eukprot:scaffold41701_cov31-Tisochrysis_lutea.AAC.3
MSRMSIFIRSCGVTGYHCVSRVTLEVWCSFCNNVSTAELALDAPGAAGDRPESIAECVQTLAGGGASVTAAATLASAERRFSELMLTRASCDARGRQLNHAAIREHSRCRRSKRLTGGALRGAAAAKGAADGRIESSGSDSNVGAPNGDARGRRGAAVDHKLRRRSLSLTVRAGTLGRAQVRALGGSRGTLLSQRRAAEQRLSHGRLWPSVDQRVRRQWLENMHLPAVRGEQDHIPMHRGATSIAT